MGFLRIDPMMIKLIITVLLASFIPARGGFVDFFTYLTTAAIALLFFMHGAKLSREKSSQAAATGGFTFGSCAVRLLCSRRWGC